MDYWSILLPNVCLLICLPDFSSSLTCRYCYAADWKRDCYLNTKTCPDEHVCFTEKNTIILENNERFVQYRMGCEHFSLCLDRVTYGDRPFGYTITNRTCCCRSLCEKPDGVGKGEYFHCQPAWEGKCREQLNSGTSVNIPVCGLNHWIYGIATLVVLLLHQYHVPDMVR